MTRTCMRASCQLSRMPSSLGGFRLPQTGPSSSLLPPMVDDVLAASIFSVNMCSRLSIEKVSGKRSYVEGDETV